MLEWGCEAHPRATNFLRGGGGCWASLSSVRVSVCGSRPEKSGFSRKLRLRFAHSEALPCPRGLLKLCSKRSAGRSSQRSTFSAQQVDNGTQVRILSIWELCGQLGSFSAFWGVPGPPGDQKTTKKLQKDTKKDAFLAHPRQVRGLKMIKYQFFPAPAAG